MSQSPPPSEIVCRPTKWFLWRALLMVVMFGGFGAYFLYDWKIGYPEKNYVIANYEAFGDAGNAWADHRQNWAEYVSEQTIPFGDERGMYPPDTDFSEKWPAILATMERGNDEELWKQFSAEKGWDQQINIEEDRKPIYKIREQLYAAAVCFVLAAVALFFLIRTKTRTMKADDQAYYSPGGAVIPYDKMVRLDKRKWESKGLASLTYLDGEVEKKAKIDGMVYGQFKEEEGAPAEALFQKVLSRFQGELIELVESDEEEEEDELPPKEDVV